MTLKEESVQKVQQSPQAEQYIQAEQVYKRGGRREQDTAAAASATVCEPPEA